MRQKPSLSRAEEVRLRRSHQKTRRKVEQSTYRPLPPVTTRASGQSFVRPQSGGKRRFQAVVSSQAQWYVPRQSGWQFTWSSMALFLVVALGALLSFLFFSPIFRVGEAEVVGAQRLSPVEINAALAISGQPIFLLRPADLEMRLRLSYPELRSAKVKIGLPNRVSVIVEERQPVILWQQGEGYTWIDANGVAFRPRGETPRLIPVVALGTPPANGGVASDPLSPAPFLSPQMVAMIQALASDLPGGTVMLYDPRYGLGWSDPHGWRVFFGTQAENIPLKLRVYQALAASLTQRGLTPALISVAYPDAPYYRMAE
ncbi:MAG: cell division protein FtsQ/DivIB [Anaerolineae bacterium]